jgi:hypothetical protein
MLECKPFENINRNNNHVMMITKKCVSSLLHNSHIHANNNNNRMPHHQLTEDHGTGWWLYKMGGQPPQPLPSTNKPHNTHTKLTAVDKKEKLN